jgi:hypothetical protein
MRYDFIINDIKPVFVVGHPYSATTFLQLLITSHPSFSSAPETHFFTYVLKPIKGWKNSKLSHKDLDLIFERFTLKPGINLDSDFKNYLKKRASSEGISAAVMLNELMIYFAKKAGVKSKRWIEKTPRHACLVPEILTFYPNARIIYIIRDPRDVVSSTLRFIEFKSEKKRWWYCAKRAKMWKKEVERGINLIQSVNKKKAMIIRYEDIIENPEKYLKNIMKFLNENYYNEALNNFSKNYKNVTLPFEESYKNLTSVGKIVDRRGIWKKRMSVEDAKAVEIICSKIMKKFCYSEKKPLLFDKLKAVFISLYLDMQWIEEVFINIKLRYREQRSILKVIKLYIKKL